MDAFTSHLSILVESGVPLLYALEISERMIDNLTVAGIISKVKDNVREGNMVAQPMMESDFFPPTQSRRFFLYSFLMHLLRTRFKKDIVCEFLPSSRKSKKAIVFCDGMPALPSKKKLLQFYAKKGFWCFHLRYRGSWESSGGFLKISPAQDISDLPW